MIYELATTLFISLSSNSHPTPESIENLLVREFASYGFYASSVYCDPVRYCYLSTPSHSFVLNCNQFQCRIVEKEEN